MLKENDIAPAFSVPNQDGHTITLDNFRGKNIVLWWYPKADTPGWTVEGKGFRDRSQDFLDKNVIILGISCDSPTDQLAFKDKFDFPFDLLSDGDRTVSVAYGAIDSVESEYPSRISYLIGPDGRVKKAYASVKPAEHPAEILADLGWKLSRP